jgi:hypothetical protein
MSIGSKELAIAREDHRIGLHQQKPDLLPIQAAFRLSNSEPKEVQIFPHILSCCGRPFPAVALFSKEITR